MRFCGQVVLKPRLVLCTRASRGRILCTVSGNYIIFYYYYKVRYEYFDLHSLTKLCPTKFYWHVILGLDSSNTSFRVETSCSIKTIAGRRRTLLLNVKPARMSVKILTLLVLICLTRKWRFPINWLLVYFFNTPFVKLVFSMGLLQCLHCTDEAHIGRNRGGPVCQWLTQNLSVIHSRALTIERPAKV